jgi:hypothetical protein
MIKLTHLLAAAIAVASWSLVGCGDDDDNASPDGSAGQSSGGQAGSTGGGAGGQAGSTSQAGAAGNSTGGST